MQRDMGFGECRKKKEVTSDSTLAIVLGMEQLWEGIQPDFGSKKMKDKIPEKMVEAEKIAEGAPESAAEKIVGGAPDLLLRR
ncbi:hypothetical protein LENED_012819 [Lentinula edodes]|uniref:Uncharacterized protein n=1 Tax=Lentinula edodes TaxID=5353 RepID=A0A1Q3ETN1_LENED|nr:hypothetical protein LENED_012819 [Lentinula edodes]